MAAISWLFGHRIQTEPGTRRRSGKTRYHAYVDYNALRNKRGAIRTFASRELAHKAAVSLVWELHCARPV